MQKETGGMKWVNKQDSELAEIKCEMTMQYLTLKNSFKFKKKQIKTALKILLLVLKSFCEQRKMEP